MGIVGLRSGCVIPGCTAPVSARGVCHNHYQQKRQATSDGVRTGSTPKLTDADVAKIKRLNAGLKSRAAIAKEMGISLDTLRKVLRGEYVTVEKKAAAS